MLICWILAFSTTHSRCGSGIKKVFKEIQTFIVMKKTLLIVLMTLFATVCAYAQDTLKVEPTPTIREVAKRLYNEAFELYSAGSCDVALQMLKKSIEKDPTFSEPYLLMARIQHEKHDYPSTEATLKSYIARGGTRAMDTVYFLFAKMYSETSKVAEEKEALDKCLELNNAYGEAYYTRGIVYFEQGDFEASMADMTNAIDNGVNTAAVYNDRGSCSRMLGKFSDALVDYTKAIERDGKAMYYCNRASIYSKLGQEDDAIADYTQAIIADSRYYKAYNGRGVVKANQGKYEDAINDFTLCLDIEPSYTSALSNRGIAYYKMREYAKSVDDFDAAIRAEPHNGNTYMYRGNVKEMMRDKQGAIDDWKKASSLGIKTADRYFKDNCN